MEIADEVANATTTLLCAPAMGSGGTDACAQLAALAGDEGRDLLVVTYDATPETYLARVPEGVDVARIILVDESGRDADAPVPVDCVSAPADLTALGIRISRAVAGTDGELAVCFDSVSTLLQFVDGETVYEFLHTVAQQFYRADARAHFHLDPAAHDDATVDLVASLCDAVVDVGDGDVQIRAGLE